MTGGAVEIVPVESKAVLSEFIALPKRLLTDDPHWIAPLDLERRQVYSPGGSVFMRRAEVKLWIARRGGRTVGRISAQIDPLDAAGLTEGAGQFGSLAAIDDADVFSALLETAEGFLKERGKRMARGPFTLSINDESGLLIDGFETPPMIMMGHDPRYAGLRMEGAGYTKAQDLHAFLIDLEKEPTRLARAALERPPINTVHLRPLDMARYEDEVKLIVSIFNDAWSNNWGFVPMTEDETQELADRLRPLIRSELGVFADVGGVPAGFILALPNLNEAIHDLDGRLLPFGWAKLLYRLKLQGLETARVALMGVRRSLHGSVTGSAIPFHLIGRLWRAIRPLGYRHVELSWILESNVAMRRLLEGLGATTYKTYRVYEKTLT